MKTALRVSIKDSGEIKAFERLDLSMTVGVHEADGQETHQKSGMSVVQVAEVSEFGAGDIPARNWLRAWVPSNARQFAQEIGRALQHMARTQRYDQAPLMLVAERMRASMRGRILGGKIRPANAAATLAAKAPETRPLVDSGQFVHSIQATVAGRAQTRGFLGRALNWRGKTK